MKRIRNRLIAALALAAGLAAAIPASAQESVQDLGAFKDWQARSFKENGNLVCTMFSKPVESKGDYTQRGEVHVFVTHRPYANRVDEVSVNIGYTFKKGAPVFVVIGGSKFELISDQGTAWPDDSRSDRALVRAMRAGAQMAVEGISSRGTKTTDSFSLSGFSAAHNAITETCKAR